jgi:SAM-dependent methyltransferase
VRGEYVFGDAARDPELERLQALERAFDTETQRWLLGCGVRAGWRCFEVGAGAGSIARWLREAVAADGRVVAIDLDTRFLAGSPSAGLEVIDADVRDVTLPAGTADLVHARFVLIHQADPLSALDAMVRLLKPGGRLVLEEPDFSMARALTGSAPHRSAFTAVNRAIARMFERRGMDHTFGACIPGLLQDRGLERIVVDGDAPIVCGGDVIAQMMAMSTRQLRDRYLETGLATSEDIEGYLDFAANPACWATYHGVVRGSATAPRR